MPPAPRALCVVIAAAALALPAGPVAAQTASPNETALAREEFRQGLLATRRQRWPEAVTHFARAYELAAQPQMLLNLAGAQFEAGYLVASAESYRRFLREVTTGELAVHRAAAREALARIEPRLAHVRLATEPSLASGDRVLLDAATVRQAALGAPLPVDPGAHHVQVLRGAAIVAQLDFEIAAGETRAIALRLPVPPPVRPALVRPAVFAPRTRPASASSSPPSWWWWGGGLALLGAGAATVAVIMVASPSRPEPFAGNVSPASVTLP